jgi:aryl-alcohol dehydrogenase-like predicted oxidoreductase
MATPATRRIGSFEVFPIGLGCMNLSHAYGRPPAPEDVRRGMPRFQPDHWPANAALYERYRALATEAGCTPAQLAIAWLLQRAPHVVPIPGTTSVAHLEEDVAATEIRLGDDLVRRVESLINLQTVSGPRYNAATQSEIDTEEFPVATA